MSDVIKIALGVEPSQFIFGEVFKHSVRRRSSRPVEFIESWSPSGGWHPAFRAAPQIKNGTAFSTWRWIAPSVIGDGLAIYCDCDQVVLADIAELIDTPLDGRTIGAVCNAVGVFGKKTPEPNKVQTSVMLMDCGKLAPLATCALQSCADGRIAYRDLMQAIWLPRSEVQELCACWNAFGVMIPDVRIIHWSHVASQVTRNPEHPTAYVWAIELRSAVTHGDVTMDQLKAAVKRGDVHEVYWQRLTQ